MGEDTQDYQIACTNFVKKSCKIQAIATWIIYVFDSIELRVILWRPCFAIYCTLSGCHCTVKMDAPASFCHTVTACIIIYPSAIKACYSLYNK